MLPLVWVVAAWTFFALSGDAACLWAWTTCSETTNVEIEVTPGDICIGIDDTEVDLGTVTTSSSATTSSATFANEFWVEDLRGADEGYYTTLQIASTGLQSPTTSTDIPAANVSVKTAATGAGGITLMGGSANSQVVVDAGMAAFQTLDSARTFIKRDDSSAGAGNGGLVGQYWVAPEIQVVVPAYTAVGSYTWVLTYTLIENP